MPVITSTDPDRNHNIFDTIIDAITLNSRPRYPPTNSIIIADPSSPFGSEIINNYHSSISDSDRQWTKRDTLLAFCVPIGFVGLIVMIIVIHNMKRCYAHIRKETEERGCCSCCCSRRRSRNSLARDDRNTRMMIELQEEINASEERAATNAVSTTAPPQAAEDQIPKMPVEAHLQAREKSQEDEEERSSERSLSRSSTLREK